jgi:hypothetical protein
VNAGVTEEVGKAASSTIEALKSTPVVLALVIFNVLYMAGSFYSQTRQWETYDRGAERWKGIVETAMKHCAQQPQVSLKPQQRWVLQDVESVIIPLPQPRPSEAPQGE